MSSPPPLPSKPTSSFPLHFALLFPTFQALDVFGPFDALNTLSSQYPSLPMRISILSSTLDPVSTSTSPSSSFEQRIVPTHTYDSPPDHPIDIIFIPGGVGTFIDQPGWKPVVAYLDRFFSSPSSVKNLKGVFTVCTGSFLLGRSRILGGKKGTLDGIHATTNKRAFLNAKEELKDVLWEPKARWVRTDLPLPLTENGGKGGGDTFKVKLWTTSGISAGIDGMFAFIGEEFGPDVAAFIALVLEYVRITDPNDDPFAVEL